MLEITKEFTFDSAHMLPNHEGKCRNLHGHTYKLQITITSRGIVSQGPEEGMLIDFGNLSRIIKESVVEPWDHAFLCNTTSNNAFEKELEDLCLRYKKKIVLLDYEPTAELMVLKIRDILQKAMAPTRVYPSRIRLYETPTSYAEWHI